MPKSRLGLINWSGHGNLGDDAMARVLTNYFSKDWDVVNFGEHPGDADAYILGGGTLIGQQSLFLQRIPKPEKTVGISLGVSKSWHGHGHDLLKRMPLIIVRDFASWDYLQFGGIDSKVGVDLLCALKPAPRQGDLVDIENWIPRLPRPWENEEGNPFVNVRLSPEDGGEGPVFDEHMLLELLSKTRAAHVTRLHALVLAWVAGVPIIHSNPKYDEKIEGFLYRVARMAPKQAEEIALNMLNEANVCLKSLL